jgi:outer membrane protein TolC
MPPVFRAVPRRPRPLVRGAFWSLAAASLLLACSAEHYREEADEESYAIVAEKQRQVFGESRPFSIEPPANSLRARLIAEIARQRAQSRPASRRSPESQQTLEELAAKARKEPASQPASQPESQPATQPETQPASQPASQPAVPDEERPTEGGPAVLHLNLRDALDAAAENNRDFMRRKELLYIAALGLTRQRWDFSVRYEGGNVTDASGEGLTGTSQDTAEGSTTSDLSARRLLATGGTVVASFVNTFVRSFTSGGGWDGSSLLSLTFTQPLLRGFGKRIVEEPLNQAERDVVYEVRSIERFRRELAVQIVSDYYALLELRDRLKNSRANLRSLEFTYIRNLELYTAGRNVTKVQADQAGQAVLRARDQLVRTETTLQSAYDRFKNTLGLPTEAEIELDSGELEDLRNQEFRPFAVSEENVIRIALTRRLDLRNEVEATEDAARRVMVAEDALRTSLDFSAGMSLPTSDPKQPIAFDLDKVRWNVALALDLPLSRLPQRNTYRLAMVNLQAQTRNLEQMQEQIKQDIRLNLRRLIEAVSTFDIQQQALRLAISRVEAAQEMENAGRGQVRDTLEAKDALLNAQNSVTSALIDRALSRLELLRDIECLVLLPTGLGYDTSMTLPEDVLRELNADPDEPVPVK